MSKPLRPVWGIFGVLCLVVAAALFTRSMRPKEIVPWRDDFAAATAEARETNKPIFAYFMASWCPPCQTMKHTTWADKSVEAALRDYVPARIDVDRQPQLAEQYGVIGLPAFIVIRADGEMVRRAEVAMTPAEFLRWLKS